MAVLVTIGTLLLARFRCTLWMQVKQIIDLFCILVDFLRRCLVCICRNFIRALESGYGKTCVLCKFTLKSLASKFLLTYGNMLSSWTDCYFQHHFLKQCKKIASLAYWTRKQWNQFAGSIVWQEGRHCWHCQRISTNSVRFDFDFLFILLLISCDNTFRCVTYFFNLCLMLIGFLLENLRQGV